MQIRAISAEQIFRISERSGYIYGYEVGRLRTAGKVAEYVTDSTGSIRIKVSRNEGYDFMISRKGLYGSENFSEAFTKEKLKDGQ